MSPADTLHVDGTITSQFVVQQNGLTGQPITILFDAGASFTAGAWGTTGAINLNGKNYITVNGDSTGLQQGIIANTANGTGLANQVNSVGVYGVSVSNVTVENLQFNNLYVRTGTTEQNAFGKGVDIIWSGGADNYGNDLVTNCTFHDTYVGFAIDYHVGCHDFEMSHCTAYNVNWGGNAADHDNTSVLTNLLVHDNQFYNFTLWDDTTGNTFHHNGFFAWSIKTGGTAAINNLRYYNNTIGPGFYIGSGTDRATSALFLQGYVNSYSIFNNTIIFGTSDYPSTGGIYCNPAQGGTSTGTIANNTVVAQQTGVGIYVDADTVRSGAGTQTVTIENNLCSGTATYIAIGDNGTISATVDYNLGYNCPVAGNAYSNSATASSAFKTLATWQAYGFDAHAVTTNPLLNAANTPSITSPVRAAGIAVSSVTVDASGHARPATPAIGAFEAYATGISSLAGGIAVITSGP